MHSLGSPRLIFLHLFFYFTSFTCTLMHVYFLMQSKYLISRNNDHYYRYTFESFTESSCAKEILRS